MDDLAGRSLTISLEWPRPRLAELEPGNIITLGRATDLTKEPKDGQARYAVVNADIGEEPTVSQAAGDPGPNGIAYSFDWVFVTVEVKPL